jgi:hypothetical protein
LPSEAPPERSYTREAPPEPSFAGEAPPERSIANEAPPGLVAAVQRNCDRADARHARAMTLCVYLLQLREHYRWESALAPGVPVERAAVGSWIAAREAYWDRLEDEQAAQAGDAHGPAAGYEPLPLGAGIGPFDEPAIEAGLSGTGLAYAAGVGRGGAPVFVLADCESDSVREGVRVRVLGREWARGLNPPVAASDARGIVIRRDAMRRWLWTRVELGERTPGEDAFGAALACYAADDGTPAAVERMAAGELETLVLHELGERRAESVLLATAGGAMDAGDWQAMIAGASGPRTELCLRAIRDLLADGLVTLPVLAGRGAVASLHFWYAGFEGVRRALAPEWVDAYRRWRAGADDALRDAAMAGCERWRGLGVTLVHAWREGGAAAVDARLRPLLKVIA